MAHKTNSKEQFTFKFYFMVATFSGCTDPHTSASSVDGASVVLLATARLFPVFSTNVLFLKNSRVMFTYNDSIFFNYGAFLKTRKLSLRETF